MSFVRARLTNGMEVSVNESYAKSRGLHILDEPATNVRGRPLPASRKNGRPNKPRVTVNEAAAAQAAAGTTWLQRLAAQPNQTGGDAEGGTTA